MKRNWIISKHVVTCKVLLVQGNSSQHKRDYIIAYTNRLECRTQIQFEHTLDFTSGFPRNLRPTPSGRHTHTDKHNANVAAAIKRWGATLPPHSVLNLQSYTTPLEIKKLWNYCDITFGLCPWVGTFVWIAKGLHVKCYSTYICELGLYFNWLWFICDNSPSKRKVFGKKWENCENSAERFEDSWNQ